MSFGPEDSASIVSQTAAKVAAELYAADSAAGIVVAFDDIHAVVTESILAQAKVVLASNFFDAPVESAPASNRKSASGKPLPSRGSSSRRETSNTPSGGGRRPSGGGNRGKSSWAEFEAPSGITVVFKEGEGGPDFDDGNGYTGFDALPDADCYECGHNKVFDNRSSHEHFGGDGKASRPYFKCANKECNDSNPAGFWPPRDDD